MSSEESDARHWHLLDPSEVTAAQAVDLHAGLSNDEAADRLGRHGRNELDESGGRTVWHIVWDQVSSVLILILVFAGGLAATLGKTVDASAILAIVALFVVLGVVQEYRAQRAIAALKQMSAPAVRLLRGGRSVEGFLARGGPRRCGPARSRQHRPGRPARRREPGAGRPGSGAHQGSEPVEKVSHPLADPDLTIGDRTNMAYKGTAVTYGRGKGVVVETAERPRFISRKRGGPATFEAIAWKHAVALPLLGCILSCYPLWCSQRSCRSAPASSSRRRKSRSRSAASSSSGSAAPGSQAA